MDDKPEFSIAAGFVARGARVLEIGCGHGAFANKLDAADYTGLEFSPAAVAQARQAGVDVRQQSIEEHAPTHVGYYDVACSYQVLEHTPHPHDFVASMARCTRSGGQLILSVPSEDGFFGAAINDFLNLPPHHLTRWSDRALTGLGVRIGLELETLVPESIEFYHYPRYLLAWLSSTLSLGLRGSPGRRLVTRGIRYQLWRVLAVFSQAFSRKFPAVVRALAERSQARGHTVVAVFRKN
jgi:SAM-dependent methyltransferase